MALGDYLRASTGSYNIWICLDGWLEMDFLGWTYDRWSFFDLPLVFAGDIRT